MPTLSGNNMKTISPVNVWNNGQSQQATVLSCQGNGDNLYNQSNVKHGVQELCSQCSESILYVDIPTQFKVGLYHSWAVQ